MWKLRKRMRAWQRAAESCGLHGKIVRGFRSRIVARNRLGTVRIGPSGFGGTAVRIAVEVPGPPEFREMMILPQTAVLERQEIHIGDEAFDNAFLIRGPVPLVFALLDEETRRLFSLLNAEGRVELSSGELLATVRDAKLPRVLPMLLDLRRRLAEPSAVALRLAGNAAQDSVPQVRLENLRLLIYEHSGEPGTAAALRRALSDPSPVIRLRAATELGPVESRDVLLKIAESLDRDAQSAEAVEKLHWELTFERAKALLDRAWPAGYLDTAIACVHRIGYSGAPGSVEALAEVVALENMELATAAAKALGSTGSPAAETPLIQALQREPQAIRLAAAKVLGRIGSAAAVLPLKETAEGSLLDPDLRRAAREAIAEIQSRIEGGSPGQLSLADAEAGRLSLASDPAGQLSISEKEGAASES